MDESQNTPDGRSSQFNSLKLVCRQLYAETTGLEIQFNCIIFTPSAGYSKPAEQCFFDFVAPMTLKKLDWLSTVIIATESKCPDPNVARPSDLPHFSALVAFAKHHPTIDLRYQFANFEFDQAFLHPGYHFVYVGIALMAAFTEASINDALLRSICGPGGHPRACAMCYQAEAWSQRWDIVGLLKGVNNFAIWPKSGEEFAGHMETLEEDIKMLNVTEAAADLWRSHIRTWFKEGIRGKE
jgi:hypothetical protein